MVWQYEGSRYRPGSGTTAGPVNQAIRRHGRTHTTWTCADIRAIAGSDAKHIALVIDSMITHGFVKRVSRGLYRLTGVV